MQYEYMTRIKGMSMFSDLEAFGKALETALNSETQAYTELGWELWHVHTLSDPNYGNNGLIYVYRRPRP